MTPDTTQYIMASHAISNLKETFRWVPLQLVFVDNGCEIMWDGFAIMKGSVTPEGAVWEHITLRKTFVIRTSEGLSLFLEPFCEGPIDPLERLADIKK